MRVGFYRAAGPWKDAAIVEFGPEGTMHYVQGTARGESGHFFATGLKEQQIIFGDTANLEAAIQEVDQRLHPDLLLVMSSPVSEIIGADLTAVCRKLQPSVRATLSVWDQAPVEGTEAQGKTIAYEKAADYLRGTADTLPPSSPDGFLVLGLGEVDYNGLSDLSELRRMMRDYFGLACRNDALGRYCLSDLKNARWILAATPEAAPLAAAAQALWGTPWYAGIPYGLSGCEALVTTVEQAVGQRRGRQWETELRETEQTILQFRQSAEARGRRRIFLDARPSRQSVLEDILSRELGLDVACPSLAVSALSTDGAVCRSPELREGDILLGSGLLCLVHRDHPSLCIDDPLVRQRTFSRHMPFMGLRGVENFLTLLYQCFL